MTPKEKAKELKDKFQKQIFFHITDERLDINEAKDCALIVINEMLNNFLSNKTTKYGRERYYFWQEVKQEIEKL